MNRTTYSINHILDTILPEQRKSRYFYSKLTTNDKVISFLRSVIRINYNNCIYTIFDTNFKINKYCKEDINNIHEKGSVIINNTQLYDYFEEKCYYKNKKSNDECKHKGFFLNNSKKQLFKKFLKDNLEFTNEIIDEITNYIQPNKLLRMKKIITSTTLIDETNNSSYVIPSRTPYTNPFSKIPSKLSKVKTIPKIISTRNTMKHVTPLNRITNWTDIEPTMIKTVLVNQNKASNIITRTLKRKNLSLLSYKLHEICNDSGYCIAFGKKTELIKKLFEDFNSKFIKSINTISSGKNGKILEILFERYKYKACTILKIIKDDEDEKKNKKYGDFVYKYVVDNLVYEYLVGKYLINNYYKKYPCFLETYGIIYNKNILNVKKNKDIFNIQNITDSQITEILKFGCINNKYFGLVIEYIKNPKTINEILYNEIFWYRDLLNVLFQIYYTLYLMRNVFTHYDLHPENVLIFKPKENHYIQYHFHYMEEVISFKSYYLVKIIDYGRCSFINLKDNINSESIYQELCNIKECNMYNSQPCGTRKGYRVSYEKESDTIPKHERHYTELRTLNRSHDLRLLKDIGEFFKNDFEKLFKKSNNFLNYIKGNYNKYIHILFYNVTYLNYYGTAENIISGLKPPIYKINNIMDAFFILKELYNNPDFLKKNEEYYNDIPKLGDLYIYDDGRDMEFIEI